MSRSNHWDLAVNVCGLLGIAALSIPALYVNTYGRLLYKLSRSTVVSPQVKGLKSDLERQLRDLRDGWSLRNSLLLVSGTTLTALSYLLAIVKALVVPAP